MVDTMVWSIRRLTVPLDILLLSKNEHAQLPTQREFLANHTNYAPRHDLALDRAISAPQTTLARALLNNNCSFAPADFVHEPMNGGTSARNPVLLRRILDPLKSGNADMARHGVELARWLLANTKQSKAVRDEIEEACKAAGQKHDI